MTTGSGPMAAHCDQTIRRAVELYEQGLSLRIIAGELGTSHPTVRKWLLGGGVELRSLSDARRASYNRMRLALQGTVPPRSRRPWTIDRTYPLSETPEAYRYVQSLHARAKVVVTV